MAITIKGKVGKILHSKGQFKLISVIPDPEYLNLVQVNEYNNISGKTFSNVEEGMEYTFKTEEDGEYKGKPSYKFYVENESPVSYNTGSFGKKSPDQQKMYLSFVLTESQYEQVTTNFSFSDYPDMINDIIKGKIDLTSVKGIGETSKNKIIDNINYNMKSYPLVIQLGGLGVSTKTLQNISDKLGGPIGAVRQIEESFYNLCKVKGLGFKKVDAMAIKMPKADPRDPKRIEAFLSYFLHEIANQGHCWDYVDNVLKEAVKVLQIEVEVIEEFLTNIDKLQDTKLIILEDRIAHYQYYNDEMQVFKELNDINNNYVFVNAEEKVSQGIQDAQQLLGITYTDEQKETIIESFNHGVFIINGKAGTGKSTIMKGITKICDNLNLTYHSMALSGRAAQLLTLKGIKSSTIHKALAEVRAYYSSEQTEEEKKIPDLFANVIIVEESSMIESGLWAEFLEVINKGSKIIIVGDTGQLSGIGHGDVLRDLLATSKYARKELMQIHRQAKESAIIAFADKVREGEQFIQPIYSEYNYEDEELLETYADKGDLYLMTKKRKEDVAEEAYKFIRNRFSQLTEEELMNYQILCPNKERGQVSVNEINEFTQDIYIPKNKRGKVYQTKYNGNFYVGDKVIVNGNTYNKPFKPREMPEDLIGDNSKKMVTNLFNGTMGIIRDISKPEAKMGQPKPEDTIYIEFEGIDGLVPMTGTDEINSINLAYAITIHRSQGMTIENVLLLMDYSAFTLLSRQLLYTGSTRASNKALIISEHNAVVKALKTDASGLRRTFLADEINKQIN